MRKRTWIVLLAALASLAWLATGCTTTADDDDSAGDDDDAGGDEAPVITNLDVYIAVPSGETEEMLNFAFDYSDAEGDIQDGQILLWVDGSMGAVADLADEEDATSGALVVYGDLGGATGFQWEATYLFGVQLVDRGGNESNELEEEFTLPAEP